ncbi:MAG: ParB/RepB/Spo0J family partition protein, partial [Anaerovoracaceae bacterium]
PIIVRKQGKGYEIVAGERRWRASREAGLKELPCIERELSDKEVSLFAIIENMQREDLNAIEEAAGIQEMMKDYGLTQEEVSKSVSKSRPYIANALRLLKLPKVVQSMVIAGDLSSGHARTILSLEKEEDIIKLAEEIVKQGLSVRETESLIREDKKSTGRAAKRAKLEDPNQKLIERELKKYLGTKVNIIQKGVKGKIEIEYYSEDERERLIDLLKSI